MSINFRHIADTTGQTAKNLVNGVKGCATHFSMMRKSTRLKVALTVAAIALVGGVLAAAATVPLSGIAAVVVIPVVVVLCGAGAFVYMTWNPPGLAEQAAAAVERGRDNLNAAVEEVEDFVEGNVDSTKQLTGVTWENAKRTARKWKNKLSRSSQRPVDIANNARSQYAETAQQIREKYKK